MTNDVSVTTTKPTRRPRRPRVVNPVAAAAAPKSSQPKRRRSKPQKTVLQQLEEQAKREKYELHLLRDIKAMRLPLPMRHVKWHPVVDYEADILFQREHLIVEVDGGTYIPYGHHNFGDGYEYDRVRDCEALCLGYTVLRVTPAMVTDGRAVAYIERVIHALWARHGRERTA